MAVTVKASASATAAPRSSPRATRRTARPAWTCAPTEGFHLAPGERRVVPTGLSLEIPPGHEGQVRPRSGLAARHGVAMVNAPGTIDSDYRGEVKVTPGEPGAGAGDPSPAATGSPSWWWPRVARAVLEWWRTSPTPDGARRFGSTGQ